MEQEQNRESAMERFLEQKIAIVTGGTQGIGRAIAISLARAGAGVVLCSRHAAQAESAAKEIAGDTGARVLGRACDVRRREDVCELFDYTVREFGGVDIVINNAGVGIFSPVADLAAKDWDEVIGTNLTGVFHCSQEAIHAFRKRGGGSLIQISSLAGKNPFAGGAAYNASKFALNGFSEAMMLDHRQEKIRVTSILPGSVDTGFGRSGKGASWKIAPEDIAEIVLTVLRMPERTLISHIEVRPSRPQRS
jgi:NAD(P)-dependent dehydrogenase (short-subunit alcohol dehydrogenase family)